jgi:hypothetical protein
VKFWLCVQDRWAQPAQPMPLELVSEASRPVSKMQTLRKPARPLAPIPSEANDRPCPAPQVARLDMDSLLGMALHGEQRQAGGLVLSQHRSGHASEPSWARQKAPAIPDSMSVTRTACCGGIDWA